MAEAICSPERLAVLCHRFTMSPVVQEKKLDYVVTLNAILSRKWETPEVCGDS